MADRRTFLHGLASLPLAGVNLPALANPITIEESLVALWRRSVRLEALAKSLDEGSDEVMDAALDLRRESFDLRATTPAGALASLEWAREEFGRHYVDEAEHPDWMDRWTLAMLDSTLGVLRTMGATNG